MAKRRPAGDGTVRKRKDGRWEGTIVIGHKSDGKPIFKNVLAKTQKELMPKLHALIEQYRDVELTEDSAMTLNAWLDRWLEEYVKPTVKPGTCRGYTASALHLRRELGEKPLRQITRTDIQRAYTRIKKSGRIRQDGTAELSDSSVRRAHTVLHACLKAAVQEGLIPQNPTEGAVIPGNHHPPKVILNDEHLERFRTAIEAEPVWQDFFYTEITPGLRLGELCGLKWSDFDEENGRLQVQRSVNAKLEIGETKTETGKRSILLPPSTLRLLRGRRKTAVSQWIFPSLLEPEKPTSPRVAYYRLKVILKKEGLPDIRFHDLRHTFATHALASGVDAKTLAWILGHTNASFTLDTYTHITDDMQKNAAEIVGGFMEELMEEEPA